MQAFFPLLTPRSEIVSFEKSCFYKKNAVSIRQNCCSILSCVTNGSCSELNETAFNSTITNRLKDSAVPN